MDQLTVMLDGGAAPTAFLAVTVYVTDPEDVELAWQLCEVKPWQLPAVPPVHAHWLADPVAQVDVSVIGVPVVPVFGPEIEHPEGAFDTTQVSV